MKKLNSWALALLVSVSGLLFSCSEDKNDTEDPTPAVPTVALSRGDVSSASVKFALALENADRAYYLCTEKDAPAPTALELLTAETFVTESGTVTVDGLEPSTTYRISAIAVRDKATGDIETLEITTSAPDAQPAVELAAGVEAIASLTFSIALTDTERAAYVCLEKTDEMTLPSAEEILAEGTAIEESGEATVEGLNPSTVYVIAAAGANGSILSAVDTIEMTTLTPTPEIALAAGETGENSLAFSVTLDPADGWLAAKWEPGQTSRPAAAPAKDYGGCRHEAFWYFDEEMARLTEARYATASDKKPRYINYLSDGGRLCVYKPDAHCKVSASVRPDKDGIFEIKAVFTDPARTAIVGDDPSPIKVNYVSGPAIQLAPGKFKVDYGHPTWDNPKRRAKVTLAAEAPADDEYKECVQEIEITLNTDR